MDSSNNISTDKTEASGSENEKDKTESLSAASKNAFNDKAWNDPPNSLLISKPKQHCDTPRSKLGTRVPYPMDGDSTRVSSATLDASAPPPMTGFVSKSVSPGDKSKSPPLPPKSSPPPSNPTSSPPS